MIVHGLIIYGQLTCMEFINGTAIGPFLKVMGNPDGYAPWIIVCG